MYLSRTGKRYLLPITSNFYRYLRKSRWRSTSFLRKAPGPRLLSKVLSDLGSGSDVKAIKSQYKILLAIILPDQSLTWSCSTNSKCYTSTLIPLLWVSMLWECTLGPHLDWSRINKICSEGDIEEDGSPCFQISTGTIIAPIVWKNEKIWER